MNRKLVLVLTLTLLVGTLNVAFNVQRAKASGTIYIRADGSIDPSDAPISTLDNVTYTLTGNVTADGDGIVVERDDIVVDGSGYTMEQPVNWGGNGLTLTERSNVTIRSMRIINFDYGIWLNSSSSNVFSDNDIQALRYEGIGLSYSSNNILYANSITATNEHGIRISFSDNNTLSGNDIMWANNGYGIWLESSHNCTLSDNNITGSEHVGIMLDDSGNNTVSGNNVTLNESGIRLSYSSNNILYGNNITANNQYGIWQTLASDTNGFYDNDITNDEYGIGLQSSYNCIFSGNNVTNNQFGVWLDSSDSQNAFHHNDFINNTHHVHIETTSYGNTWDDGYPSGGNYWSDYTGVDANHDGIGDTAYVIDANNTDHYPLMNPWAPPAHELVVSLPAPVYLKPGSSLSLNATVNNQGLSDETNIELWLLINGTTVNSTTFPLLQAGSSYTLSYSWTPTVEGTYNATAYASPVSGETSLENNLVTKFVTVTASLPPGMQVGVKAGDWIKCTYAISGWPSGTPSPEWLKVEFLSVEGTNATVRVTMHMSDGTEQNATMPVDVVAGGETFQGLSGFVIPANCTTGDSIYMSGYGNVTIAGETTDSYAGATRTVVHASFSQYGTELTYYWDKLTGAMVEASVVSGDVTATGKATETNMWQAAPSFPIDPIILSVTIAIVIVIALAIFLVRRKKKPPEEVENSRSELRLTRTGFKRNFGDRITRV